MEPSDPFFRREAGRLVSALTRMFGVSNLALAEDVMQETLCRAVEVWRFRGLPDNPSAWLMVAAKRRALTVLTKERRARGFAPALSRHIENEWSLQSAVDEVFEPKAIKDDQLRVMFSCCHPRLPEEAQVALMLNILCGFSVGEIASALLKSEHAIEKRLARSKKLLAGSRDLFAITNARDFPARLCAVQRALYLLFSEGYHGSHPVSAVRVELCREAMYLAAMLAEHPLAATPSTCALLALMFLHAARLPARLDAAGNLTALFEQDRRRWDGDLAAEGHRLLALSASGDELSEYHLEAAIAGEHAIASGIEDTDWGAIVSLYDALLAIRPSPVVALHRAVALAEQHGPERGLDALRAITEADRLSDYPFYHAAVGELELRAGDLDAARVHFREALSVARNPTEKRHLEARLLACDERDDCRPIKEAR